METYLVGGAVRDELLGLPIRERDWVVVGSSPAEMLERGFKQVGKDFPVFLHPDTGEEYALARTERKTAAGYHGFDFDTSDAVSLEDDLLRRDLTVNAIAKDERGHLIDPHGGEKDLRERRLRHVSPQFAEDPVRILRAARFAARFSNFEFLVDADTRALMREMSDNGEVDHLQPDRVWKETERALMLDTPARYFQELRSSGALARLFPWLDALFGIPQTKRWHPEVDSGVHTMMVLSEAAKLSNNLAVRFAALTHDLGKGATPEDVLPGHRGHEARSVDMLQEWFERYPVPNACRSLAQSVAEFHGYVHRQDELRPKTVMKLFEKTDALRRPDRFDDFLLACEADSRGRLGLEDQAYPQAEELRTALAAASEVTAKSLNDSSLQGKALGEAIRRGRIKAIASVRGS